MKKKKEKKTPTYLVTDKEIENYIKKGFEQGYRSAIEKATDFSLAVPIMVLRDEFDFGQVRIKRFADAFLELYDSIDKGYLDINDIIKTIDEETDVKIVRR